MPIIVERLESNADRFSSVTGPDTQVVGGLDSLKQILNTVPDEYAVVLGPAVDLEAGSALADTLRVTRPAISVILIRQRVDTHVLSEALRSGMREVLEDRDLTGLGIAVKRAKEIFVALHGPLNSFAESDPGQVITVFSPKGGVGKTTLAVNLSMALADKGKKKVCLVDLDLGFGDVAITLQVFPTRTIADAIQMEDGLDFGLLETLLTPYRDGVAALAAPVQPDAKDAMPASLTGKIIRLLKQNFDFVVIDSCPAFDEHVLQALDESNDVLLVTTLDVPTLKNVKIAFDTLDLLNFPTDRRRLVLNRADDQVGLTAAKVENTLGLRIAQSIPTSPKVANSTNAGEPIVSAMPRHPVSQAIMALAKDVAGGPKVPSESPPVDRHVKGTRVATSKRGILRRSERSR